MQSRFKIKIIDNHDGSECEFISDDLTLEYDNDIMNLPPVSPRYDYSDGFLTHGPNVTMRFRSRYEPVSTYTVFVHKSTGELMVVRVEDNQVFSTRGSQYFRIHGFDYVPSVMWENLGPL